MPGRLVFLSSLLFLFSGCSGNNGTAKLAFSNGTTRATLSAPTIFGMKLIAVYLTEDVDPITQNNVGMTTMIYLNPLCQEDIMHCDISGGTAEDGLPMDKIITDFFDFAQTTEAVNAALNAQGRAVTPGTYKYARVEFCKYNAGNAENIKWGNGSTGEQSFKRNSCTVNSAVFNPPITIAGGETVTVTLSYVLDTSVQTGADAVGDHCTGAGAGLTCFSVPQFTPSATRH